MQRAKNESVPFFSAFFSGRVDDWSYGGLYSFDEKETT